MRRFRLAISLTLALALGGAVVAWRAERSRDRDRRRPNVLFICVDTLRADRVGAFGGPPDLTPNLDRLVARGTRFTQTIASAPFTAPAVTTLCTGVPPTVHGVRSWRQFGRDYAGPTLAETLRANGYRTAYLGANGFLKAIAPIHAGYDRFDEWRDLPAPTLARRAIGEIDDARANDRERPWFLWVHFFDPHVPYRRHPEQGGRFAVDGVSEPRAEFSPERNDRIIEGLYHGEVAFVDGAIGALLAGLEERGVLDDTLIVLVSDHGENMWEHEPLFGHNDTLFDTLVHIPLAFVGPGVAAGHEDAGLAGGEDVARTVLELAGVPVPLDLGGTSLAPGARGRAREPRPFAHSDAGIQSRTKLLSFRTEEEKLIRDGATEPARWYEFRLRRDPGEWSPKPVRADDPRIAAYEAWLESCRREHLRRRGPASSGPGHRTAEELRQLKAFGYLD